MKSVSPTTPAALYNVMAPHIDEDGCVTYYRASQCRNLHTATTTAHRKGGRVVEVNGHNNRQLADFWAGSQAESQLEALLKSERVSYRDWKLSHNVAQVFH